MVDGLDVAAVGIEKECSKISGVVVPFARLAIVASSGRDARLVDALHLFAAFDLKGEMDARRRPIARREAKLVSHEEPGSDLDELSVADGHGRSRKLGLAVVFNGAVRAMRDPGVPSKTWLRRGEAHVVVYQLQDNTNTLAFEGRARHRVEGDRASVNSAGQRTHSAKPSTGTRAGRRGSEVLGRFGVQATRFSKPREKLVVVARKSSVATVRSRVTFAAR